MAYLIDPRGVLTEWEALGLYDIVLPIVLIWVLVFTLLQQTKLLGGVRAIDAIVSLLIGFFAIQNPFVSDFFLYIFQHSAIAIVSVLAVLLVLGFFMKREGSGFLKLLGGIAGISIIFFGMSRLWLYYGWPFPTAYWIANPYMILLILFVLIVIIVMLTTTKEEKKELVIKGLK